MDLDLVGYLFGLLDPDDRARTEIALAADPAARARFDRLKANLAPLAAAREEFAPPPGLADRAIEFVVGKGVIQPSRRPVGGLDQPVFAPSRWRRLDAVIAASVLILIGGLGVSSLGRLHKTHAQAVCENNMRQIGQSLVSYSNVNGGRFPQVNDRPPHNFAGAFVPILQAGQHLSADGVPPCPIVGNGSKTGGYNYSLGYRRPDGTLAGMTQGDAQEADLLALLADPPAGHRDGHNVLYVGGHVRYCTSPFVGVAGDNIYDNKTGKVAAGVDKYDSVLGDEGKSP